MSAQEAVLAVFVAADVALFVALVVIIRNLRSLDRPNSVRRTTGGYPSGSRPVSELTPPAFITKPRAKATGLFRETAHECCPPVLKTRGNFRFRCPVCHSEFDKATGEDWELAQRHGVQWVSVDDPNTSDKPRTTLICNDADHHPYRCDCGHGRPS